MDVLLLGELGGGFLLAGSVAILVAFVWTRVRSYGSHPGTEDGAVREAFSMARYEPMKRLLSEEDLEFLKKRRRVPPEVARKLRAQRCKVFRAYLNELASDFSRLHRQAKLLVANAPEEDADLVGVLMRQQATFWMALIQVETRLALHQMGIGQVDVTRIFGPLQVLENALKRTGEGGWLEPA